FILHDKPNDLVALRYWLGLGNDNWRKTEYKRLTEYCEQNHQLPQDILSNLELCNQLRIIGLQERWAELQRKLHELSGLTDDEVINLLLPLEGEIKKISEAVRELRQPDNENQNLIDLLTQAVISTDQESSDARINIMTIYGAKGLTSHTVILTSLINGLLPAKPNPQTLEEKEKLEEERRLVYVALTRAKNQLIISSFRKATRNENLQLRLGLRNSGYHCRTQQYLRRDVKKLIQ
ncbi:MAG TPA: 3'-5' exonuclease, partial [Ignavibacteriaceae bacterium]